VPQDFIAPESGKSIELRPRLVNGSTGNQAKVQIIVLQDGKQIGSREVTFRLKYNCRTAVTLVDIPAGSVINSENIKIVNTLSNHPEPADWKPPFGLITKRNLPANTVLSANMVAPAGRPLVVERNQNVVIRIEKPGLLITALGKTMENGRAGEYIKVRNVDSQRIILAKVNEDGTVEPVL
jgi:flagella basal body P-ring formation protein FlgA